MLITIKYPILERMENSTDYFIARSNEFHKNCVIDWSKDPWKPGLVL